MQTKHLSPAEFERILGGHGTRFKLFSLLILVVHTASLENPSDATLASLSISKYIQDGVKHGGQL